ncbi:MFS transporter [Candidatus Villigracilis affinis]|uniref:MFS transporter n=1 Tax=Candidatus Villigracilis affinis TaxID=3140682 RepID=UPI001DA2C20B|nr:MFS transporter [Anaerolineales bacterium]
MKKIWPFSYYFIYFAGMAAFIPYIVLYYQTLGFSGTQIGMLVAISPLVSLVGGPLMTGLADSGNRHRLVMSLALGVAAASMFILPFLQAFLPVLILIVIFSFVSAPANSLADSAAMSMLGDEKHLYGRVRMGGTFGWALAAPLAGIVVARYGLSWAFWVYAFSMFVALLISQNFLYTEQKEESSFWQGLRVLLGNRQLMLFLFMAFICGTAFATVNNYLFAYMNQLHIDESRMGYALTIATAAEIPVLFFANRLLIRFKPRGLLILSMAATGVRLVVVRALRFPDGHFGLSTSQRIDLSRIVGGRRFLCQRQRACRPECHHTGSVRYDDLWFRRGHRRIPRRNPFGKTWRPDDVRDLRRDDTGHARDLCFPRTTNCCST